MRRAYSTRSAWTCTCSLTNDFCSSRVDQPPCLRRSHTVPSRCAFCSRRARGRRRRRRQLTRWPGRRLCSKTSSRCWLPRGLTATRPKIGTPGLTGPPPSQSVALPARGSEAVPGSGPKHCRSAHYRSSTGAAEERAWGPSTTRLGDSGSPAPPHRTSSDPATSTRTRRGRPEHCRVSRTVVDPIGTGLSVSADSLEVRELKPGGMRGG